MTRINTNVSSLIAQNNLARSNSELQTSLTRLSTGLRINRGADDPAGLIASEALRSDIISTEKAISNSERANQLIATADSALGQVSNLLNDIRGLVTEAANTGALSDDQIAANQLQLDSSLEAIDRIAQVTSFQGKRLLDGNLDFITAGVDNTKIQGLQIDQANFGTQTSINAQINVVTQATRGQLNFSFGAVASDVVLEISGANGSEAFNFAAGSSIEEVASAVNLVSDATGVEAVVEQAATAGSAVISSFGADNDIQLTATEAGFDAGNVRVKYTAGTTSGTTATYTAASGGNPATIDVQLQTREAVAATGTINDTNATNNALNVTANIAGADFNGTTVQLVDDSLRSYTPVTATNETFEYSADAKASQAIVNFTEANTDLIVTANKGGSRNNEVAISFADAGAAQPTTAVYDEDAGTLVISVDFANNAVAVQDIKDAIATVTDNDGDLAFTATDGNGSTGLGTIDFTGGAQAITGNTGFSGGDAGTLFIYIQEGVTTADDIRASLTTQTDVGTLRAAELFSIENTVDSDGSGVLVAQSFAGAVDDGVEGGDVIATANDVITAINDAQTQVEATLATGNSGFGVVSTFQDFAYSGSVEANNRLQFLAPANSPNISFVAGGANQTLGLDLTSSPRVEGFSSFTVQNDDADGSFTIASRLKGTEYDGYTISVVDNANVTGGTNEFVIVNKDAKTIEINIDDGVTTTDNIVDTINNDDYASQFFVADSLGLNGTDAVTIADLNLTADSKTSGGLQDAGSLIFNLATDANGNVTTTANDLIAFFDDPSAYISDSAAAAAALAELTELGISVTNVSGSNGTGVLKATTSDIEFGTNGTELENVQASGTTKAVNGENAQLTFTAVNAGAAYGGVNVVFADDTSVAQGSETGSYDANTNTLTFAIDANNTTAADIENIFDSAHANYDANLAALFSAAAGGTGAGVITVDDKATLSSGVVDNGTVDGTSLLGNSDLANQGLTFRSTNFGSAEFVSVKALQGTFELTNQNGVAVTRSNGTDVNLRINGIQAIGKGLKASINTSSLDVSFSLSASTQDGASLSFNITGGGARFQLGPDVVSNQQARLGIQSVNTATLGGVNGRLFELRSGGAKSLSADVGGAAKVIDEVISVVTSLRGRLGAFQKTTLDSNISSLNDTLANLTEAESSIRDADFAVESAKLTRAQILVQSGTSVLGIANSNPQNALSLLR